MFSSPRHSSTLFMPEWCYCSRPPSLQHPRPMGWNQDPSGFYCGRALSLGSADFVGGCADSSADVLAVYYINAPLTASLPRPRHTPGPSSFYGLMGPYTNAHVPLLCGSPLGGLWVAKRKCPSVLKSSRFRIKRRLFCKNAFLFKLIFRCW